MKINGKTIKTPSAISFTVSDVDGESYRNAKGKLVRDRIAVKRKLECEWSALTIEELSTLLKAVADTFFKVTYLDGMTGKEETKTFYVGDRTAPVYSLADGLPTWKNLKMNFVEQ